VSRTGKSTELLRGNQDSIQCGHQRSDPGGGHGRVDAGRSRRCHQLHLKGAPRRGNRIGNWLTREQAQGLLSLPDRESLKGIRDSAILALLLCCGLRRLELVPEVMVGAIAQRENRWVLVDITGKGNRIRTVAVPAWVKAAIDEWTTAAGITEGKIFRAVRKGGKVWGEDVTTGAVLQIVQHYARDGSRKAGAPMTCAAPVPSSAASGSVISGI
jgi:integrase